MNGQCQRYHEYDTSPTATIGRDDKIRVGSKSSPGAPPAIIKQQVPTTGNKVRTPGYGFWPEITKKDRTTKSVPTIERAPTAMRPLKATCLPASARTAPAANSQAREVGL